MEKYSNLILFLIDVALICWPIFALYSFTQYYITDKALAKSYRSGNIIVKLCFAAFLMLLLYEKSAIKSAYHTIYILPEKCTNKAMSNQFGVLLLIIGMISLCCIFLESQTKNKYYYFETARKVVMILYTLAFVLLSMSLIIKGNAIDIGLWHVEITLDYGLLILLVILSSFNISISKKRKFVSYNFCVIQKTIFNVDDDELIICKENIGLSFRFGDKSLAVSRVSANQMQMIRPFLE